MSQTPNVGLTYTLQQELMSSQLATGVKVEEQHSSCNLRNMSTDTNMYH